jgi:hypothetical protein
LTPGRTTMHVKGWLGFAGAQIEALTPDEMQRRYTALLDR